MKTTIILAGLAMFATPVLAQTTSPAPPPPETQAPAPADAAAPAGGVANTALSNAPTPSDGARAQQGNSPMNSAAAANNSPAATSPDTTPPEAPLDHYPICKANQFDKCMEPGNGGGHARHGKAHRPR